MRISKAALVCALSVVATACAVESEAPPVIGDVGDNSGQELKVGCTLARSDILASVQGGRRTAIERGFAWYDAQIPYSQSKQYDGYRTDCSGFVSMCWELGNSYTTANFVEDTGNWSSLGSFDELTPADAMVYRSGGSGHIMMFVGWNDAARTEACVLEQASTADDMQFRARTTDSLQAGGYHAIRATKLGSGPAGKTDSAQCYCDAQCSSYGDCCSSCAGGSGGSSGSGGGAGSAGSAGAGSGGAGGNSGGSAGSAGSAGSGGSAGGGQCYCDAQCGYFGDCCTDCGGSGGSGAGGSGAGGSGAGGAGGSGGGQCYCDAQCFFYGDCCTDCS
ncbi:MAG: hypothetical protein IPI67_33025 [Myxococcales bacterium]|nr:hypothetical protein [Myxococcales bacterium]